MKNLQRGASFALGLMLFASIEERERVIAHRGHYIMYLHAWEFDPAQPRVNGLGVFRTFRHYNNLSRTLPRLRRLIGMLRADGARFVMAREFVGEVLG